MKHASFVASAALFTLLHSTSALAAPHNDMAELRAEIQALKNNYESRIAELETKLEQLEQTPPKEPATTTSGGRTIYDNSFNPSIGLILNGRYSTFSEQDGDIAGFAIGEEGERGKEGFALDESELNFAANVDDKFFGSLTAAIVREDGEDIIELEEAFVQTSAGVLPWGISAKAGRFLATMGYLNEKHTHTDDFADRPLPYRAFLNNAYNDDGLQLSTVLPIDLYTEIGGGVFRGDDYPFGEASGEDAGAWSAFARVGGDIGDNQTWRTGLSTLQGEAGSRLTSEDAVNFTGDSALYMADLRYTWSPTGNANNQEVLLQGEYFWRDEDGSYEDTITNTGLVGFDDHASGWYMQGVYKFLPQWRVGTRYSRLNASDTPFGLTGSVLDSGGHDPEAYAAMLDWTNSEFSRVRLQYNYENLAAGQDDNQFLLQYIMSLGAHAAHSY